MSILADREIKALCTKPKFVVFAGDQEKPVVQNFFIHDNVKEFVDAQNQQMFGTSSYLEARSKFPESIINTRWIGYRDATESDLENWKPLIAPFTDISVKELNHIDIRADLCKKIILTTDTDLIADGVQAIDDNFLEWFGIIMTVVLLKTGIDSYNSKN